MQLLLLRALSPSGDRAFIVADFRHMRTFLAGMLALITHFAFAGGADSTESHPVWVRSVVIHGNEKTKDFVILREMSTKVGARLDTQTLAEDQNRIYSLKLFNKVTVSADDEGDSASVHVNVNERWYWFPFPVLGFRYRDFKKFYYGAGFAHQNFLGRNEKLFTSFALGYDQWFSLHYQNPKLTDDDDIFLGFDGSYGKSPNLSELTGSYDQYYYTTNMTLGKRYGLHQTLLGSVGYDILIVSDPKAGRTLSSSGRDAYAYVALRYTYDSRNIHEYATDGDFATVSVIKSGFGESQVNLVTYDYDVRKFLPLSEDLSIGARTFGTIMEGGSVPVYHHVYFGYGERLRGYFRDILEGEDIMGGNLELRIAILKPRYLKLSFVSIPEFSVWRYGLYAGIFADGGKVWYRSEAFPGSHWLSGYGAGLHFLLPYSIVIRTEYALNNYGRGQIFVDIGASF
jgi:outer membrane protein assembly factor BamA